ncbi:LacI family DNA-binding transcriptional regulator [uncultured Cohaesibacter sp.]|uniref:LacI family DNA-binding transcriptional regulator n=1 Tax=uncultured Cohaesibacter sp. TaxID=1002546 RepID=UPI0029C68DAE|nr:LacI family DNA-binding transcriptional regulator [uncultured Cohaesibacter sp.]
MKSDEDKPRPVTSVDVALKAGVSRSAVSRSFTPGASVAPETRERVLKAAAELGYRVNQLARSLTNNRSALVGIVAANMDNPFRVEQIEQISRRLIAQNFRPILMPAEAAEDPSHVIGLLLEYSVSGVIVTSDTPPEAICQECISLGVPVVLVNKRGIDAPVDRVLMDNENCGRLAAEALAQKGCRQLALITSENPSYSLEIRQRSFLEMVGEFCQQPAMVFRGAFQNYEGGVQAMSELLTSARSFDGIFCVTDYMALGALDQIRLGTERKVPEDLQVIGCDDIRQCSWQGYRLSTIRQDTAKLAEAVVEALLNRFSSPNAPATTRILPVELIERSTTRSQ